MALPDAFNDFLQKLVWVAWNDEEGHKVPKSPSGGNAKSNDPATWGTYDVAYKAAKENGYSGIGIMLADGLVGIDLDGAVDRDGNIKPWAQEVIDEVGSYAEKSPSGNGVHILAQADIDEVGAIGRADHRSGIEVYNHGRYFTVTGNQINAVGIVDRTAEIAQFVSNRFSSESPEDRMREAVRGMASDQVRRRANETTLANAKRDDRRFARKIGSGETCTFCMMLASRGFVYYSEDTAGKHWHNNCKCEVVPGFKGMEIEGVDLDAIYDTWREFERIDKMSIPTFDRHVLKTAYVNDGIDYEKVQKGMEKCAIPEEKLTKYSLDPERQPDKAEAFKLALGYTKEDSAIVAAKIYVHMADNAPIYHSKDKHGVRYTTKMYMDGKNGKVAKVLIGWIDDFKNDESDKIRATTIHVDK